MFFHINLIYSKSFNKITAKSLLFLFRFMCFLVKCIKNISEQIYDVIFRVQKKNQLLQTIDQNIE